jgi:hypothetical protein
MKDIIEKFKSKGITAQYFISFALIYIIFEIYYLVLSIYYGSLNLFFSNLVVNFIWILIISIPLFPIYFVIRDKRLEKERKIGWLLLVFFFSWLAFAFYLIKKKD